MQLFLPRTKGGHLRHQFEPVKISERYARHDYTNRTFYRRRENFVSVRTVKLRLPTPACLVRKRERETAEPQTEDDAAAAEAMRIQSDKKNELLFFEGIKIIGLRMRLISALRNKFTFPATRIENSSFSCRDKK